MPIIWHFVVIVIRAITTNVQRQMLLSNLICVRSQMMVAIFMELKRVTPAQRNCFKLSLKVGQELNTKHLPENMKTTPKTARFFIG